ncbi:plasmodesmata callose-binding protein 3 [Ananas comosus]|uniref:Plasmodesmata callose-binding protein 3 n=1 Tax=Ananas comosus TaxID=4615 RepID=A0A199W4S1_ANACO|nr:plasmodesmata callose-binding protein 3 [Ananas comosus]
MFATIGGTETSDLQYPLEKKNTNKKKKKKKENKLKSDQSTPALQKTLDYACGAGADCNPILQNGACYNPNTVVAHCSYAANSYYQRKGQAQGACDFAGTATLTSQDPSTTGCSYPATPRNSRYSNQHKQPRRDINNTHHLQPTGHWWCPRAGPHRHHH